MNWLWESFEENREGGGEREEVENHLKVGDTHGAGLGQGLGT